MTSLSYQTPDAEMMRRRLFLPEKKEDSKELMAEVLQISQTIEHELEVYLQQNHIGTVHLRNLLSLPLNLPASLAWQRMIDSHPELHFILHHHDFIWEGRQERFQSPYAEVNYYIAQNFPPIINSQHCHHVVLNTLAKKVLADRGVKPQFISILPDSFDFTRKLPDKDEARILRKKYGLRYDDLVIGVMSRIVKRKSIEFTLQIAAEMKRQMIKIPNCTWKNVTVILCQKEDLHDNLDYYQALLSKAEELRVEMRFIGDGEDFYDLYAVPDAGAFTSTQEGFGNQLLEFFWAGIIPYVFEYPVFSSDIKKNGFHYISLGNTYKTLQNHGKVDLKFLPENTVEKAVTNYLKLMLDENTRLKFIKENFQIAQRNYGLHQIAAAFDSIINTL